MKIRKANTTGTAVTRQMLGLSQQQMAELLGVSKSTIGMVETGQRKLPVAALLKVADLEVKLAAAQKQQELLRSEIKDPTIYSSLKTGIMNYTVSLIMTVPDCQALINIATTEKDTLAYRKLGLERQRMSATITSQEIESSLLAVTTELQALQSVYNSLPEGPAKVDTFNNIKRNEYKKFLLEQRKENYGVLALLQKEYDIASIDRSIVETDDFIGQLRARMDEIN